MLAHQHLTHTFQQGYVVPVRMYQTAVGHTFAHQYAAVGTVVGTVAGLYHGAVGREVGVLTHKIHIGTHLAVVGDDGRRRVGVWRKHQHTTAVMLAIVDTYAINSFHTAMYSVFCCMTYFYAVYFQNSVYNTAVTFYSLQFYIHNGLKGYGLWVMGYELNAKSQDLTSKLCPHFAEVFVFLRQMYLCYVWQHGFQLVVQVCAGHVVVGAHIYVFVSF